ncbi:M48 family metallopeptidase [Spongiimicrobium salis]|uniref:M48 family metallopeptidase n=1 Tax=Spongiimicrobium salis TaxID=1667022 RepID=UPI00374D0105
MAKSLFFFSKREKNPLRVDLTAKDEPVLFDYLYKLADEAGAPRPHKVFLTDRVNASVSYDLSILNLLFPSKKNLEIGLGLVNVLNLGEFKAVLAHEYGHFAQRSMLLGRYVYTAQQVAAQIVGKRDIFDSFLSGISSIDIRIAWIGWILSILVWAIRSLIETCFGVVSMAERALSREMEFQADLVAVSLTGSDALIHALYKLQIADEAYANTQEFVNNQLQHKKAISNMYVIQSNYISKMATLLGDPMYGKSPEIVNSNPDSHRIFTARSYNPPQMWATHPADKDREENAKALYISAEIDDRQAKSLLSDPLRNEQEMTAALIATAKVETMVMTDEEGVKAQNKEYFNWTFLDPKYHSFYLNRFSFVNYASIDEVYGNSIITTNLNNAFTELYPEEIRLKMDQIKEVREEIDALIISENEVVTVEKRRIWHRGEQIKRKDITTIIKSLKEEEKTIMESLIEHDRFCRKVPYAAALKLGNGWSRYLKNLASIVHYAEHTLTNLNDSALKFHNVLNVVLADGRVSSSELNDVLTASNDYYRTVRKPFVDSLALKLDASLLHRLDLEDYKKAYEEFKLGPPEKNNINEWIQVIDGWGNVARNGLNNLRNAALERLLDVEETVKNHFLAEKEVVEKAPTGIHLVEKYDLLLPGKERSIQRKLGFWDRFIVGEGLFASTAKFGVSGAIILGALLFGSVSQKSRLHLYNGLHIPVYVIVDEQTILIDPNDHEYVSLNYDKDYVIKTTTTEGAEIETITSDFENPSEEYVYNIANAGVFVEYPVYYGYEGVETQEFLGAKKWFSSDADHILEEPPSSISTSSTSKGGIRDVLTGYSNLSPGNMISIIENEKEIENLILSHVKWDSGESPFLLSWMNVLQSFNDNAIAVLNERLKNHPDEVQTMRALQDQSDSIQRAALCAKNLKAKTAAPNDPDKYYLATRCMEDDLEKNKAFISGYEKWQDHPWLAFAAAYSYTESEAWEKAYRAFYSATQNNLALAQEISLDSERVRRLLRDDFNIEIPSSRTITSDVITAYDNMEKGVLANSLDTSDHVFYLIGQGKLQEAYDFIANFEEDRPYVLRLLAASQGVPEHISTEFDKLDENEGITSMNIWSSLGLTVRNNKDTGVYMDMLKENGIEEKSMQDFIAAVEQKDFRKAGKIIERVDFRLKAGFYVLGNVMSNYNTPQKWKSYINSILFVNEKPFIQMKH